MAVNHEMWLRAVEDAHSPLSDDPNAITAPEFAQLYPAYRIPLLAFA